MTERDVIERTKGGPVTVESLSNDLVALGVRPGMVLLVHSSLSALGWVCGGGVAVIYALERVLGGTGTLVMPTHSSDLSDPQEWSDPPVPDTWKGTIRDTMPAYDRDLTPTRGMGIIPEVFRKQPGVLRSEHPQISFAAWGAQASEVIQRHGLDFGLGEDSPLARIYELDGWVLLLGVGHENNTSIHLAEYRASFPGERVTTDGAPMLVDGQRKWVNLQDLDLDNEDFAAIGEEFVKTAGNVRVGRAAQATALLMPQRALVDYAVRWMEENRRESSSIGKG